MRSDRTLHRQRAYPAQERAKRVEREGNGDRYPCFFVGDFPLSWSGPAWAHGQSDFWVFLGLDVGCWWGEGTKDIKDNRNFNIPDLYLHSDDHLLLSDLHMGLMIQVRIIRDYIHYQSIVVQQLPQFFLAEDTDRLRKLPKFVQIYFLTHAKVLHFLTCHWLLVNSGQHGLIAFQVLVSNATSQLLSEVFVPQQLHF